MAVKRIVLWLAGMALLTAFIVGQARQWQQVLAEDEAVTAEGPQIGFVIDTTASMQPEINALAQAVDNSDLVNLANPTFHRVSFKDEAVYQGSLTNTVDLVNWINSLQAQGGDEDCRDALLQALGLLGRNLPNSRALLLSDAAPMGSRTQLAFVINKLAQQRMNVFPVISGWCEPSELTQSALFSLARMTGGVPYIVQDTDVMTATQAALNAISRLDTLIVDNVGTPGLHSYELNLDSTVTTLGVDDYECPRIWCLTCTLRTNSNPLPSTLQSAIQMQIRDPQGNLVDPGAAGVTYLETSSGVSYRIDVSQVYTGLLTGTWKIQVNAPEGHIMNVSADSNLHFKYLGRPLLRANKVNAVRVSLTTDAGAPNVNLADVHFGVMSPNGSTVHPINLFDDGAHGDGQAGDGIYGGPVTPQAGIWYMISWGTLEDGSTFQRTDPTPVRVRNLRLTGPADGSLLPGSTVMQTFTLSNEGAQSAQTYELLVSSSQGWAVTDTVPSLVMVPAGESVNIDVPVVVPSGAALGEIEETTLTAVDTLDISDSDALSVNTTVVDKLFLYLPTILKP